MLKGVLVVARFPEDFAKRVLRIGRGGCDFRIAFQRSDDFARICAALIEIQITKTVEVTREIWIDLESGFQQGPRAIIILLKEKPLSGNVQDVLVAGVAFQKVIHAGDGRKQVVLLDLGHPANQSRSSTVARGRSVLALA